MLCGRQKIKPRARVGCVCVKSKTATQSQEFAKGTTLVGELERNLAPQSKTVSRLPSLSDSEGKNKTKLNKTKQKVSPIYPNCRAIL